MAIRLTQAEVTEIERLESEADASGTGYWRAYEYIAQRMAAHGAPRTDAAYLWLLGATEANAGRGAFSALIRGYTETQSQLRYGDAQSGLMQAASDAVARAVIDDVRGVEDVTKRGLIPSIGEIADQDAVQVGTVLFSRTDGDTAHPNRRNAAWSGALLFSLLNSDQTGRLTSTGASATAVDTANDWRDVLFSLISYRVGLIRALGAFALSTPPQRVRDATVLGLTLYGALASAVPSLGSLTAALPPDLLPLVTNPALRSAFTQINELGLAN